MKQILVGFAIMSLIACAPSGHDSASKGVGMPSNFSTWSTVDADRSARRSSHSNFGVSQPPIFKISFRNGSASYLFGTVHMGISLKELPQWLLDLHDKTKVHAYEMNKLKEIRALRNNRGNADFGTLEAYSAGGKPLTKKNVFSEAEIAQLAKLGIPEAVARSIGDNNCSIVATRKQLFAHDRYDSIDGDLEERTAAAKKTLFELETDEIRNAADKYAADRGYKDSCTIRELLHNSAKLADADREIENLFRGYRNLSLQDLASFPSRPADDDPGTAYRNRIWVPEIVQLVRSQPTFIAVGFMHLIGPEGLVQLLRNQGLTVEPMSAPSVEVSGL